MGGSRLASGGRVRGWLADGRVRAGLSVVAVAATVAGLATLGNSGYEPSRVALAGGRAWLASPAQGLITLVDGAAEQVVASIRPSTLIDPDADLSVVQSGANAYVANAGSGTVSRVDGSTYDVSAPVQFGGGKTLTVLAGGSGLYIVDGVRRLASVTDPTTLRVKRQLTLSAQPGVGQSVVDGDGRLWTVDANGLASYDEGGKQTWPGLGGPGAQLVLVQGEPVLVDPNKSRIGRLRAGEGVVSWACLDLNAGDEFRLLGSSNGPYVYIAVKGTGTLLLSSISGKDCGTGLPVGKPGAEFGPLAETAGYVFVPNRTTGHAVVVDTTSRQVVADLPVLQPGRRLELVAQDGVVFYNDPGGDKAGVLRLVGGRWVAGRSIVKYRPGELGDQAIAAAAKAKANEPSLDAKGGPNKPKPNKPKPDQPKPDQPKPSQPRDPNAPRPPDPSRPNDPPPSGQQPDPASPPSSPRPGESSPGGPIDPSNPGPSDPGTPPTDPSTSPPSDPTTDPTTSEPPPPPLPPEIQSIQADTDPVVRERTATISANVTNAADASWSWQVLRPNGSLITSSTAVGFFTFAFPAGTPDDVTVQLTVTPADPAVTPARRTQVLHTSSQHVPSIGGIAVDPAQPAIGQQARISATEPVAGADGIWEWTITPLDGGSGGLATTQRTAQAELPFTFPRAGQWRIRLDVTYDGAHDFDEVVIGVVDGCRITAVTASPIDLISTDQVSVSANTSGCFSDAAATPRVQPLPSYLQARSALIGRQDNGTGQGSVTQSFGLAPGDPPTAEQVAITFRLPNGSEVSWVVQTRDPNPTVPNVVNDDLDSALDQLHTAGFTTTTREHQITPCEPARVRSTNPAGGTEAPRGSNVVVDYEIGRPLGPGEQCP